MKQIADTESGIGKIPVGEDCDVDIFMREAIIEAQTGIRHGDGGPFGSVIVKNGRIIGRGHNCVVSLKDPTMHGEISAIKDACKNIDSFNLYDCELYTTAEPCPMCLGAVFWAGIKKVHYGCNIYDSEKIGFKDSEFYNYLRGEKSRLEMVCEGREDCLEVFEEYSNMKDKTVY